MTSRDVIGWSYGIGGIRHCRRKKGPHAWNCTWAWARCCTAFTEQLNIRKSY